MVASWEEMASRSWPGSAGSIMASSYYQDKVSPTFRPCGSNNVYYSNRGKGTGRQAGSGSGAGRVVRRSGSESGQARVKNQVDEKKIGWEKTGPDRTNACKLDKQEKLTQTANTGRNTQRIIREDGRHLGGWRQAQGQVKQIRA